MAAGELIMALRIKGIEKHDANGRRNGEAELWAYSSHTNNAGEKELYLSVTNQNGAGRTAAALKLTPEQAAELTAYLNGSR